MSESSSPDDLTPLSLVKAAAPSEEAQPQELLQTVQDWAHQLRRLYDSADLAPQAQLQTAQRVGRAEKSLLGEAGRLLGALRPALKRRQERVSALKAAWKQRREQDSASTAAINQQTSALNAAIADLGRLKGELAAREQLVRTLRGLTEALDRYLGDQRAEKAQITCERMQEARAELRSKLQGLVSLALRCATNGDEEGPAPTAGSSDHQAQQQQQARAPRESQQHQQQSRALHPPQQQLSFDDSYVEYSRRDGRERHRAHRSYSPGQQPVYPSQYPQFYPVPPQYMLPPAQYAQFPPQFAPAPLHIPFQQDTFGQPRPVSARPDSSSSSRRSGVTSGSLELERGRTLDQRRVFAQQHIAKMARQQSEAFRECTDHAK